MEIPQKYWNCKVFLCLKLVNITQLNSLFVWYFWSSYCRCLIKLLKKWAQFINNYQKSTLGRPRKKQFVLKSCFFYVLPRHTNKMTDKGFSLFDECASRCVHLPLQEEECTSSWGNSKMYTSGSIASSQRVLTEIRESRTIAKTRISVESDTVSCLHIQIFFFYFHMSLKCFFKSLCPR